MGRRIVQIAPAGKALPRLNRGATRRAALGSLALSLAFASLGACKLDLSGGSAARSGPGGPFNLMDQDGRPANQQVLTGKWSVVFFGYTYCPDVCPTTLTVLGRTMDQLGPKAKNVQVVFITVDPERDTPAQLKTYIGSKVFPKNMIALTGTPAEIAQVAHAYAVFYQKSGSGSNYTVDHSVALYLMDPKGRFNRVIADGLTPDETGRQISEAMSGA